MSNLSLEDHVANLVSKASRRLHLLRELKRAGLSSKDLLTCYFSFVRSTTEYACQVWSTALTSEQSHAVETILTFKCARISRNRVQCLPKAGVDLAVTYVLRHRSTTVATANKSVGTLCVMTKLQDTFCQCDKSQRLSPHDNTMTRGRCLEFYLGQTEPVE